MASVNLTGTLTNPEGEPDEGAIVKFTLLTTTGNTVSSSKSQLEVPQDGLYDIDIVYGNLRVDYINEDGTTRFVAIVTVNGDTVATSLPELLNAAVPPTNAQLLEFQAILADAVTAQVAAEAAAATAEAFANSFLGNGFLDYNDTSTSTTPVTIVEDVWTTLPNNGAGAFSNSTYGPAGVTTFMDTTTGAIDPRELTLGDTLLIRNDFTINPNTNNALLEFRYELGAGGGLYTLSTNIGRLDDGSGKNYRFSLKPDLIYMGDTNTRDNLIKLQVRLSTNGTLVNAGSVIQLIRGNL